MARFVAVFLLVLVLAPAATAEPPRQVPSIHAWISAVWDWLFGDPPPDGIGPFLTPDGAQAPPDENGPMLTPEGAKAPPDSLGPIMIPDGAQAPPDEIGPYLTPEG